MPATAVFLQQKLGAGNCPAFDLTAACAGFIFGLSVADQFVKTGAAKRVLVVGVELLSRVVNWKDRTTCVLFGDGAGAAIVGPSRSKDEQIMSTVIGSDGSLADALKIPAGGSADPVDASALLEGRNKVLMLGPEIFKAAVRYLHEAALDAMKKANVTKDDVDWVCAHQANSRILEMVYSRLGIPREKILSNIELVGNTSSASIPILLDESLRNGTVKKGQCVLMTALGAGVSYGGAVVRA